jgi:hypothetical protein
MSESTDARKEIINQCRTYRNFRPCAPQDLMGRFMQMQSKQQAAMMNIHGGPDPLSKCLRRIVNYCAQFDIDSTAIVRAANDPEGLEQSLWNAADIAVDALEAAVQTPARPDETAGMLTPSAAARFESALQQYVGAAVIVSGLFGNAHHAARNGVPGDDDFAARLDAAKAAVVSAWGVLDPLIDPTARVVGQGRAAPILKLRRRDYSPDNFLSPAAVDYTPFLRQLAGEIGNVLSEVKVFGVIPADGKQTDGPAAIVLEDEDVQILRALEKANKYVKLVGLEGYGASGVSRNTLTKRMRVLRMAGYVVQPNGRTRKGWAITVDGRKALAALPPSAD